MDASSNKRATVKVDRIARAIDEQPNESVSQRTDGRRSAMHTPANRCDWIALEPDAGQHCIFADRCSGLMPVAKCKTYARHGYKSHQLT